MARHRHDCEEENDAPQPRGFKARVLAALLAGMLIGVLAGTLAMLLLAPRSGKKTRSRLQRQGHDLGDQTAESIEDVLAQARDITHQFTLDARKQAKQLEKRGQAMLDGHTGN